MSNPAPAARIYEGLKLTEEDVSKLVRNSYIEGFAEGMNEYQKPRTGGKCWEESKAYRALLRALQEKPK